MYHSFFYGYSKKIHNCFIFVAIYYILILQLSENNDILASIDPLDASKLPYSLVYPPAGGPSHPSTAIHYGQQPPTLPALSRTCVQQLSREGQPSTSTCLSPPSNTLNYRQ